ncbi:MAG: hypothetical protein JW984_07860 [Deltaproteobacteria bacterium]|uniref:Glycosyl transferase family 28 C-terminal domain-containing protein n=1 Tax=Candidatus Zymogenus saltonus TaxID=2844893 RepID=A0A9D8PND9_9DELT|nr:hypothetical protein [Candidatus Zymogenus saltonus]
MAKILLSPLSWGLGHATRDMPIINLLIESGHEVGVAATGVAYTLLKREYPDLKFYRVEDYPSPYTRRGFSVARLLALFPLMYRNIIREHRAIDQIVKENGYDLVISDNRFGAFAKDVPSLFISHQIRFSTPGGFEAIEKATEAFNEFFHRNFDRVIIPDNPPGELSLSGKLGHAKRPGTIERAYYAGILSNIRKIDVDEDIDYLISISGPKETKRELQKVIMDQIDSLDGKKVLLMGDPESYYEEHLNGGVVVKSHASRIEMEKLLNRAKCVITRSGYTTIIELAELGGKKALLIPTPGQTEQEYLSRYYSEMGWFHSVDQRDLDLERDIAVAKEMAGLPAMPRSVENEKRLYEQVIRKSLSKG